MATVTIQFGSVNNEELRRILLAHKLEFEVNDQPRNVESSYIREHDRVVGCFVRVEGPEHYCVTTLPLAPASAVLVAQAATP